MENCPLLKLIIPFIAGIVAAVFIPVESSMSYVLIFSFLSMAGFLNYSGFLVKNYHKNWLFGLIVYLLLFATGFQLTILHTDRFHPQHMLHTFKQGDMVLAGIDDPLVEKTNTFKTEVSIQGLVRDNKILPSKGKAIVYFKKHQQLEELKYGDLVMIDMPVQEVRPPGNPAEFNYRRYLSFHQIYHQVYVPEGKFKLLKTGGDNWSLIAWAENIRKSMLALLVSKGITGDEFAISSALLLGHKEKLEPDLINAYSSAGAMHVLAVSGLHVGIIYLLLSSMLGFTARIKNGKWLKMGIVLLFLWFYASLTGFSPSVLRAATMFSFIVVGTTLNRNTNIYNTLAASAFLLLLINPYLLMEVGFQLSYLAVIGIVFIQPRLYRLWDTNNWLMNKAWALTTVSIAAQIVTFPLALLYFHQFPNYFLLSNLIVIPAAALILYLGVAFFILSPVPYISDLIAWMLQQTIVALNYFVKLVEQLPFAITDKVSIPVIETWMIYLIIICMLAYLTLYRTNYLKIALGIAIVLLGYQLAEQVHQHKQQYFIVYNVGKSSAFDFISGKRNVFLADSAFRTNESKMLFHIRHNWWALGISETGLTTEENKFIARDGPFVQFGDKRIAIINKKPTNAPPDRPLSLNYLVLSKNPEMSIDGLKKYFDFELLIIDSSNSFYRVQDWKQEAEALDVAYYSVRDEGAFIAELD